MIINLTAFSQNDTTPANKCFPTPVVKLIVKDLLSGDSAKALLKLTEEQLDSTEKKVAIKDSIIGTYKQKEANYDTIIRFERDKFTTLQTYTNKIEIDLKNEKIKGKLLRWANYGLIGALGLVAFLLK
jgi:hypothetical protein